MVIKFSVREQTISLLPTKSIPRIGSKDYLVLQFVFSNDWDSLSKVVYLQKDSVSEPIELVGDTLKVPEWFTEQDTFNVTLLGVGDTQEVPTNVVAIKLEKSNTLWNEDAPVPQPSWLVTVLEAAKRVEEAVVNPPKIGENGNWFVWDFDSGAYVDTGVKASGGDGKDGYSPTIDVSRGDGTTILTITDVNGTKTADIPDGKDGAVLSVNGRTGDVRLTAGDIDAIPSPATATVGQIVRVKAVDDAGKPTEWETFDGVQDVTVCGNSIVDAGVASIPQASSSEYGVIKPITVYGVEVNNNGALMATARTAANYDSFPSAGFISKGTLENIINRLVKAAMCDGTGAAWTDAERIAALLRMGCTVDDNGFVKWTAQEATQ